MQTTLIIGAVILFVLIVFTRKKSEKPQSVVVPFQGHINCVSEQTPPMYFSFNVGKYSGPYALKKDKFPNGTKIAADGVRLNIAELPSGVIEVSTPQFDLEITPNPEGGQPLFSFFGWGIQEYPSTTYKPNKGGDAYHFNIEGSPYKLDSVVVFKAFEKVQDVLRNLQITGAEALLDNLRSDIALSEKYRPAKYEKGQTVYFSKAVSLPITDIPEAFHHKMADNVANPGYGYDLKPRSIAEGGYFNVIELDGMPTNLLLSQSTLERLEKEGDAKVF